MLNMRTNIHICMSVIRRFIKIVYLIFDLDKQFIHD